MKRGWERLPRGAQLALTAIMCAVSFAVCFTASTVVTGLVHEVTTGD